MLLICIALPVAAADPQTPITNLSPEELISAYCPVDQIEHDFGRACTDHTYGGCDKEVQECSKLREAALDDPSKKEEYASRCVAPPDCPIMNATETQMTSWDTAANKGGCDSGSALAELLLPNEKTLGDLTCWRDSRLKTHLSLSTVEKRCNAAQEIVRSCQSAACPIPRAEWRQMAQATRKFCAYPDDDDNSTALYACTAGPKYSGISNATCPPTKEQATDSKCKKLGQNAPDSISIDRHNYLPIVTVPLMSDVHGPGHVLPGLPHPSIDHLRMSWLQYWSTCNDADTSCAGGVGWWRLFGRTDGVGALYVKTSEGRELPVDAAWTPQDFSPSTDCPSTLVERHHCEWGQINLDILLRTPNTKPLTRLFGQQNSADSITSIRCYSGSGDYCVRHTTFWSHQASNAATTTEAWTLRLDGWQITSVEQPALLPQAIEAIFETDPSRAWRIVAALQDPNGLHALAAADDIWSHVSVSRDNSYHKRAPVDSMTAEVRRLTTDGSNSAKERADFAVGVLLGNPARVDTTSVVQSGSGLSLCWFEKEGAVSCRDSKANADRPIFNDRMIGRLYENAREKLSDFSDSEPNRQRRIDLLRVVERILASSGPEAVITDTIPLENGLLSIVTQGEPTYQTHEKRCRVEFDAFGPGTDAPKKLIISTYQPEDSKCADSIRTQYSRLCVQER